MKTVTILGNKINAFSSQKEGENIILKMLMSDKQHFIVTANPEILLEAKNDEELFFIINKADLVIPDGFGIQLAAYFSGIKASRIAGADLMFNILDKAQKNYKKVAFIVWRNGLSLSKDIEKTLKEKLPDLNFFACDVRRSINFPCQEQINKFSPDVLLVGLGSPWQEKFIFHNLKKMPSVKLAIGIGGAFDFLTGKIKRAPLFMRRLGCEWLWRLWQQPQRWPRILKAAVVFPYIFIKYHYFYQFFYRPNVVCFLYKKEKKDFYVLLVEREDEPGHWQLPQGGRDGMKIEQAGAKELREEINCDKFKIVKAFSNLYKYKFANHHKNKKHIGYKGQKQSLVIAEFLGEDRDIKVNFWEHRAWRWVKVDCLPFLVHQKRQAATKIFLEKFKEFLKNLK